MTGTSQALSATEVLNDTAGLMQEAADELAAVAIEEKRLEQLHRRRAQRARRRLEYLRRACEALGIRLIITHRS